MPVVNLTGMTSPLSFLTAIFAACAAVAWMIASGVRGVAATPGYTPIAALLTWLTTSNLWRAAISYVVLAPVRAAIGDEAPFSGAARWFYFAEISIRATWPFALLGAGLTVFVGRRAWPAALAWAAASAALCWIYPEVRRQEQAHLEAWIAIACWVVAAALGWWGHFAKHIDRPHCFAPMAFMLSSQLAVTLVVRFGGDAESEWSAVARPIQGTLYAGLLCYQLWMLSEQNSRRS